MRRTSALLWEIVRERRRGAGPLKSRDSDWSPQSLSPAVPPTEERQQDPETLLNHYLSGYDHGLAAASASSFTAQNPLDALECQGPIVETDTDVLVGSSADWLLPDPQSINLPARTSLSLQPFQQFPIASISSLQRTVPDHRMSLDPEEELALTHYRTAFSLSQTTRDPQWSTPALLLLHALKHSEMLLHLILAVSLHDMSSDAPDVSRLRRDGHRHYEKGTEQLMQTLQCDTGIDHLAVLASFYCIYMYMSRSSGTVLSKLDRLSLAATEHLEKHKLTVPDYGSTPSGRQDPAQKRAERSLIARTIMWLMKIDAQGSFLGCKSSLVDHFQAHPEQLSAVQADSRLALQLNWGAEYPISQSIRDIESCLPVDMMTDMLVFNCKISDLSHMLPSPEADIRFTKLQEELAALELRYGAVFYYGSSDMTLQPAMKLNCANSATMFHALRIYLLRSGESPFGAGDSAEVQTALGQLLMFARHVCPAGTQQPVYEFQWSLFIAALETSDMIHREWLQARISDRRFCEASQRIASFKRGNSGTVALSAIRQILQAI
ncbi:hypothetical protein PVAG01_10658 [Phlyctema vagabunda]|uniref:Transcription factor domain-containing protein n=1 Tax=Phlyctema vagabunda TaxID=108571 RepID=A0ABR4P2V9_9HELO